MIAKPLHFPMIDAFFPLNKQNTTFFTLISLGFVFSMLNKLFNDILTELTHTLVFFIRCCTSMQHFFSVFNWHL